RHSARVFRRAESGSAPPLHLDEADDAAILGDEVELPRGRPEVPVEDSIAGGDECPLRGALPVPSRTPGTSGSYRRAGDPSGNPLEDGARRHRGTASRM